MKLSVEAKVAAAIAAGFVCLTVGAIAQAGSGGQTGPNDYSPIDNPGMNKHMSKQTYNASPPARTNADENSQNFSDPDATGVTANKSTKSKTANSRHNYTGTTQRNRGAQTKRRWY